MVCDSKKFSWRALGIECETYSIIRAALPQTGFSNNDVMRWESEYADHVSCGASRCRCAQPRRATRFALNCELLESRQLLSIGQPGLASGLLLNSPLVSGQPSVPVAVASFTPAISNVSTGFSVQIIFATMGNLNFEIAFFGGGQLFSPTPGPSFASGGGGSSPGGGGFSLGTLPGSLGNSGTGSLGITGNGTGQTGFGLNLGSTSTSSITPLNPAATSILNTPGSPVYVVPPPLAALAVHLGSSTGPPRRCRTAH